MEENEINLLIVEDEALIAQNLKMQLENFGYSVAGVCYKYQAAEKATSELDFDILITDINLGNGTNEMSGIQIAEQVKQRKNCPIIFLTAFSDKDTIKKATTLAPSAYLVKPVNTANLFAALQLAVNNFKEKTVATPEIKEELDFFFVKKGVAMLKVFWKDAYHFEHVKNYVKVRTTEYQSGVLLRCSLNQLMQNMLPPAFKNKFIKINRAEAILKSSIIKVDKEAVETKHGQFKISSEFRIEDLLKC